MITLRLDKKGGINKGDINMIESDNKSDVYIIQLYKGEEVYNLTGKTIELSILEKRRKYGDTFELPVYEATQGKIKLEVVEGMTKTDGLFYFQITVKDSTGLVDNFPIFPVEIKNSIKDDIIGTVVASPYMKILLDAVAKAEGAANLVDEIETDYTKVKSEIQTNYKQIKDNIQTDYAKVKEGIQKDYDSLQQIMIDDNQAANLQAQINKSNEQLDKDTKQLSGRIDTIISNNNNTEGNSELVDIRIGNDGTVYKTAGECVRNIDRKVSEFVELKTSTTSSNIYNLNTSQKGTLNTTGVFTSNSDSAYICSDYIKLNKGKPYAFSYGHATLGRYHVSFNRFVAYNLSKTFLAQTTSDSNLTDVADITVNANREKYTLVVPKQDIYIRFQVGVAISEIMVKNGTDNIYEPYGDAVYNFGIKDDIIAENNLTSALREKINKSNNQDTGEVNKKAYCRFLPYLLKKGICIGDSLTEGYHTADDIDTTRSYPAYLSRMMNCDITNAGQSGITVSGWYNAHISKYNYADYDFAIIYLGTNGGMTDTLIQDTTISEGQTYKDYANTHTGSYCKIIETILEQNPKCKIYLIRWDGTTTSNVTQQIANRYNLDTINLLDKTYFDCQDSKYHTDPTHYNSLGYCNFAWNNYCHINDFIENNQNGYKEH